jgi:hypothetical protein
VASRSRLHDAVLPQHGDRALNLSTGETAVTSFSRFWKPWGIIFALGAILPNAWPGWAAGAGTAITFLCNLGDSAVPWIAAAQLWAIALAVSAPPVVYQFLEKTMAVLLGIIVVFAVIAIIIATEASSWGNVVAKAPEAFTNAPRWFGELGAATILGAMAFAGAGGANYLVQSNYVRDKGMGMGLRISNVVSPITGQEIATPSIGYTFPLDEENERRWNGWWRLANIEQLIVFLGIGLVLLISLSVLVNSTISIQEDVGTELGFIQDEARALGNIIGAGSSSSSSPRSPSCSSLPTSGSWTTPPGSLPTRSRRATSPRAGSGARARSTSRSCGS